MKLACQLNGSDILPGTEVEIADETAANSPTSRAGTGVRLTIALFRPERGRRSVRHRQSGSFFAASVLSRGLDLRTRRRALGRQPAHEAALSPERWPLFRQPRHVGAELPR